jgi:hypothetical protein
LNTNNGVKSKHSEGGTVLSKTQAQQVIDNAKKLGIKKIDSNPTGLQGLEKTGNSAGKPHFKVENVHIYIDKGISTQLKF